MEEEVAESRKFMVRNSIFDKFKLFCDSHTNICISKNALDYDWKENGLIIAMKVVSIKVRTVETLSFFSKLERLQQNPFPPGVEPNTFEVYK